MKKIFLIILGILFLCSCDHKINKGIVTNKCYIPMTTSVVMISTGKTIVPATQVHPQKFILKVKDGNIEEEFIVSSETYKLYSINDSIYFKE